jgi:hypothetical protein
MKDAKYYEECAQAFKEWIKTEEAQGMIRDMIVDGSAAIHAKWDGVSGEVKYKPVPISFICKSELD